MKWTDRGYFVFKEELFWPELGWCVFIKSYHVCGELWVFIQVELSSANQTARICQERKQRGGSRQKERGNEGTKWPQEQYTETVLHSSTNWGCTMSRFRKWWIRANLGMSNGKQKDMWKAGLVPAENPRLWWRFQSRDSEGCFLRQWYWSTEWYVVEQKQDSLCGHEWSSYNSEGNEMVRVIHPRETIIFHEDKEVKVSDIP